MSEVKIFSENIGLSTIYAGDCFDVMPTIPDGSVDAIIADLPYGKTRNKWDSVLDLGLLWAQYERVIKPNGVIILFGSDKFTARVMLSKEKLHRYNLVWEKTTPTGHLNAKKMPLRSHEDIMVFYKKRPEYHPQKTKGHIRKVSLASHKIGSKKTTNYGEHGLTSYDSDERYPKSVLKFPTDKQKSAIHPTQKPVGLLEFLIKSYTNEGDVILDNVMGGGSTIVAANKTKRRSVGIEKDFEMFLKASERIKTEYAKCV